MKKLTAVLLAATALVAWPAQAHAAFALGGGILTLLAGIPATGGVALSIFTAIGPSAFGSALLGGLAAGAQFGIGLLSRRSRPQPEAVRRTTDATSGPGRHAFGRVLVEASLAFGDTNDALLHRLGLQYFGPRSAIEAVYVNDIESVVDAGGTVLSPPWIRPIADGGGSYLYVNFQDGDGSEVAWPALTLYYPDKWDAYGKNIGIAQYLAAVVNPGSSQPIWGELFGNKGYPIISTRERALEVYDPRDGLTKWTRNGALIALHYFRIVSGLSDSEIDFTKIGEAADWCDDNDRTVSGAWEGPVSTDIVLTILESAGLEVRFGDDNKVYFAGLEDYPEAEATLRWQDIIDWRFKAGPEGVERPNYLRIKYFSPESRYVVEEIPNVATKSWAIAQDEVDAYGEQELPLELTFCDDYITAQEIGRRLFEMERAEQIVVKTNMVGRALRRRKVFDVELDFDEADDINGPADIETVRCRLAQPLSINDADGTCEMVLKIIPSKLGTKFNRTTDPVPPPPTVSASTYDAALEQPLAPSAANVVQYPSGAYETRVLFEGVPGGTNAEVIYNTYTGDLPDAADRMTGYQSNGSTTPPPTWLGYLAEDLSGEKVTYRSRFYDGTDMSNLSETFTVNSMAIDNTAPGAPEVTVAWNAGDWDIDYVIGAEMSAVSLRIETKLDAGSWTVASTIDVRPFDEATISVPAETGTPTYTTEVRLVLVTSNGTLGTYSDVFQHIEIA